MAYPDNTDSVAQDQLRSFVERIERIETEIADLNADKSEVYKDAKGNGFDVKVLRKVIADRRKDATERAEFETIYELYMSALGSLVRAHEENIEEFRPGGAPDARLPPKQEIAGSSPAPVATIQSIEGVKAPMMVADDANAGGQNAIGASESGAPISEAADLDKSGAEQSALAPAPQFVLRPHCLHPELCAGQGRQHCYACTKAMTVNGSAA